MSRRILIGALMIASLALATHSAVAQDKAAELSKNAQAALDSLYSKVPEAKALGAKAQAILVFPRITKAGLGIGGQRGEGALMKGGKAVAYYNTTGASIGLQAGAQTYGYAMFFMNDKALQQLDKADGFEVGVGPSVVVVDEGMAKNITTTTVKDDIYAFVFGQKGLMGGSGSKATRSRRSIPNSQPLDAACSSRLVSCGARFSQVVSLLEDRVFCPVVACTGRAGGMFTDE
jgi:lipid-binding SYLF domain-containing protein